MFLKKENIKWKVQGALLTLAFGLTVAVSAHADADLSKLKIWNGVKPGMWLHTFTTIPKNHGIPDRREQGCVSAAQLRQMVKEGDDPNMIKCSLILELDTPNKAVYTVHCPAFMNMPQYPIEIVRGHGMEHWIVTAKMPASNGGPAIEFKSEYTRLGACKAP
ncbi:MAG: hypothetical protein LBE78_05195 [Burkholderiaceae bacterium]|jgi:hypothetical protein|nr:hypothetical protein [Burkholderiaceae bacterium]